MREFLEKFSRLVFFSGNIDVWGFCFLLAVVAVVWALGKKEGGNSGRVGSKE